MGPEAEHGPDWKDAFRKIHEAYAELTDCEPVDLDKDWDDAETLSEQEADGHVRAIVMQHSEGLDEADRERLTAVAKSLFKSIIGEPA